MDDSTVNKTSHEFLASGIPQLTKMGDDASSRSVPKYNSLQVLNRLALKSNRNPEQQLAPINQKIVLNNGGNPSILFDIPSSPPTDPVRHVESNEEQKLGFLGDLQISRSGNRISSLRSSAPSVNHDALGDREECGQKHDDSTRKLQQDTLARAQELKANLQEELQDCQKKSGMLAKQLPAGGQRRWTEWQKEKQEQKHKDEIKKIKIDHALELKAQKEALQKATEIEIDMVKLQLMQELNSRVFQEVTKACKKQELYIKQLNRINRNLEEEKKEQEMDMKAYRNTIASQEEDLLRANRRVSELMQTPDESQEFGRLHATIKSLDKTAKEAISQAERRGKDLGNTMKELEIAGKEMSYALDSASDAETAPGSSVRAWDSSNYTSKGGSEEHELEMVTKKISTKKALVESQGCQINLPRQGILRLEQANEKDDTVIKQHRRKIRSLEELSQRFSPWTEKHVNLKAEISQLSRVEQQDKAIVKQQQSGIGELLVARANLKETQESLDQSQTNLSQAMIKLEQVKTISKQQQQQQQQSEIDELVITKAKLKELQRCLNAKQTNLEKTMMKLGQVSRELQNLRRAQGKSNATREEPPKSYQGRCALADGRIHSERITSATSSYPYQRSFHGKTANTPGAPKGIISSFQDVELGGRDGESKDEDDDEDDDDDDHDDDDDDDGDKSLHKFLQRAVSRGAAIMTNLENKAERLVIASGWLGGSGKPSL